MYMFRLTNDQFVGLFLRTEHGFVDLYIFPERPIIESQRQWGVLDQGLLIKCYAVYRAILIQSQGKLDLSVWRSQPHAFIRI